MNMSPSDRFSSTSPSGTTAVFNQDVAHNTEHAFLNKQSLENLTLMPSMELPLADHNFNIDFTEQAITPSAVHTRSSSSGSQKSNYSSRSPCSPLSGFIDKFAHMTIDMNPTLVAHDNIHQPRLHMRERSAPLPSAPPSTPASVTTLRTSLSQPAIRNSRITSIQTSPVCSFKSLFFSPLTDNYQRSDPDSTEHESESSGTTSIEIISASIEDSFVSGFHDTRQMGAGKELQVPHRVSPPGSPPEPVDSIGTLSRLSRPSISRTMSSSTATPLSHTLSSLPTKFGANVLGNALDQDEKSVATSLDSVSVSQSSFDHSCKSTSPSCICACQDAHTESQLSPVASSPVHSGQESRNTDAQYAPSSDDCDAVLRTSNVYINGLPPHFPDESLYLMTREFGQVLSVRTFTRCVGEKMSGYGFVLFDSIESAERCIESLRKYRNLHPSFSKQVHKIPGTPYASGTITIPPAGSLPSLSASTSTISLASFPSYTTTLVSSSNSSIADMKMPRGSTYTSDEIHGHRIANSVSSISMSSCSGSEFSGRDTKDLSFREKMEMLKDERSTNLYMEGLPLTIDDDSLAALVSPHKIVSNRFFQTKLSNPPRMIAFVRLNTRQEAEEVIERLHGRVVRGWNDNGCRISVRFADTSEQRELRKTERISRGEEEEGAGRLSIAQAALLNLRGAEAHAQLSAGRYQQHMQGCLPAYIEKTQTPLPSFHTLSNARGNSLANTFDVSNDQHSGRTTTRQQQDYLLRDNPTESAGMGPGAVMERAMLQGSSRLASSNIKLASTTEAHRMALLHQEMQLQQQLMQQIHGGVQETIDTSPTYHLTAQAQIHPLSLMPSADFHHAQMHESRLRSIDGQSTAYSVGNHQNVHLQNQKRAYIKATSSELPCTSFPDHDVLRRKFRAQPADRESSSQQHERRTAHPQLSLQLLNLPGYSSPTIMHSDHDSAGNTSGIHHRTAPRDLRGRADLDVSTISPALTYASRSPSTLSPSTPLFCPYGTPASAPATVSCGKTNTKERRMFKHDTRP